MNSVIETPNPIRPPAFQRWLAASAIGMLVGMTVATFTVYLLHRLSVSLPPGSGWPVLLIPPVCVLGAYGLLQRMWPDRVTLTLQDGRITGAARGLTLPAGRGVVSVTGDYGRTARGIYYDVYTIRYLSRDTQTASTTLRAGCTDPVRVRDFAEALCELGAYGLRWQSPGSREYNELRPEGVSGPIGGLTSTLGAMPAHVPAPAAPRTRLDLEENGVLRVRTGGPRPSTVARIVLWFLLITGTTAFLEVHSPGSWWAIFTGAISLLLGLLLLLTVADSVIRYEYYLGTDIARGRTILLGVPFRSWSVPASAIRNIEVRDDANKIDLAGPGFRRRIRLGMLPRPGEVRWVAAHAGAAITGTPLQNLGSAHLRST